MVSLVNSFIQILQDNFKVKVNAHTQADEAGNADAVSKLIENPAARQEARNAAKAVQPCFQTSSNAVDDTQLTSCNKGCVGSLTVEGVINLADTVVECNSPEGPTAADWRSAGDERANAAASSLQTAIRSFVRRQAVRANASTRRCWPTESWCTGAFIGAAVRPGKHREINRPSQFNDVSAGGKSGLLLSNA
jgi:hypothetical protein